MQIDTYITTLINAFMHEEVVLELRSFNIVMSMTKILSLLRPTYFPTLFHIHEQACLVSFVSIKVNYIFLIFEVNVKIKKLNAKNTTIKNVKSENTAYVGRKEKLNIIINNISNNREWQHGIWRFIQTKMET